MALSTVLYEYDEDLTANWRTARAHRTRHHVSQAYYIFRAVYEYDLHAISFHFAIEIANFET